MFAVPFSAFSVMFDRFYMAEIQPVLLPFFAVQGRTFLPEVVDGAVVVKFEYKLGDHNLLGILQPICLLAGRTLCFQINGSEAVITMEAA